MRVLVTYASKRGGTKGLAEAVATGVARSGHAVYLRPVGDEVDPRDYDAVIIGAALYVKQWTRSAQSFVRRHRRALRGMPVWMFSSGPLDHSASRFDIPPTATVAEAMRRVAARGHRTFGGRLAPDADGMFARAIAESGQAGDYRDMAAAARWGREVALEIAETVEPPPPASSARPESRVAAWRRRLTWRSGPSQAS